MSHTKPVPCATLYPARLATSSRPLGLSLLQSIQCSLCRAPWPDHHHLDLKAATLSSIIPMSCASLPGNPESPVTWRAWPVVWSPQ